MKTLSKTIIPLLIFMVSFPAFGQQVIELYGFGGYTFRDKAPLYGGGQMSIEDGPNYGGSLSIGLNDNLAVEILYSYQDTEVRGQSIYFDNGDLFLSKASMNYLLVGGTQTFPALDEDIQGFFGAKVGVGWLTSTDNQFNDATRFAVGLNGGGKFFFTQSLGLKIGAHLYFPVTNVGAGFGWSSSGGTSVGVSGWSPIMQFGFDGGLVIRLGS